MPGNLRRETERLMRVGRRLRWGLVLCFLASSVGCSASHKAVSPARPSSCGPDTRVPSRIVALNNGGPQQTATLSVGDVVAVDISNPNFDVSEPAVTVRPDVVCRISVTAPGHTRRGLFLAQRTGSAYISATITGAAGGINHPAYGLRVRVR